MKRKVLAAAMALFVVLSTEGCSSKQDEGGQDESDNYVILECAWGEEADDPAYGEGHIACLKFCAELSHQCQNLI